jgi:maltose O-acetyltransferase
MGDFKIVLSSRFASLTAGLASNRIALPQRYLKSQRRSAVFGRLGRMVLRLKTWWLLGQRRVHVYGRFTAVSPGNIRIGTNVAINHDVFLLGRTGITIGDNVVLSARCMLIDGGLISDEMTPTVDLRHSGAPITLHDGAWIGAGAIILPGVTIGRNAVVGAGSVVTKDVAPGAVVAGNPARTLTRVSD